MSALFSYDVWSDQRVTLAQAFNWSSGTPPVGVNLTGCRGRCEVLSSAGALILDLSTLNGGVTLDSLGNITLLASQATMGAIAAGTYSYDLLITMSDGVTVNKFASGTWHHGATGTTPL